MFKLVKAKEGEIVKVVRIKGYTTLQRRLMEMGIFVGSKIKVEDQNPASVVIEVKGTKLAISREIAQKIFVEVENEERK